MFLLKNAFCSKLKEARDTANSASSGSLSFWVPACELSWHLEKSCFFEKIRFSNCYLNLDAGLSGSLSCCHFLCGIHWPLEKSQVTNILFFLSCLGVICSGGTPGRVFLHYFRKVFGPARVRISLAFTLRSGFVATSKRCAHVWAHKGANMLHGRKSHA